MAEFERVEIPTPEDGPLSEQDIENLEQEEQAEIQEEQFDEERPEWLPEKFQTPQDMAKAYEALQSEFTQKRQNKTKTSKGAKETDGDTSELSVESFRQFSNEFAETGDVSEESRNMIVENMGLPREMVDAYVAGQKAVLDAQFNQVYSEVGGEESYDSMVEWAAEHLSEGDQNAFNEAVTTGTQDQMMFAIRNLAARWQLEGGQKPAPLIQGSTSATGASGAFRSLAELTAAMKDPRYTKDAAYRKDVEVRLSNSNIL